MNKFLLLVLIATYPMMFICGQCTDDITLMTQEEVDAFPQNYGCSVIEGSLSIGTSGLVSTIKTLDSLYQLTTINGALNIHNNVANGTGLETLSGLEQLVSIGGGLGMTSNNALTSLEALGNVSSFGGGIWIANNWNIENLSGLEGVTNISGNLSIYENNSLENLNGLENVVSIGMNLSIHDNPVLTSLDGLESLTSIADAALIHHHGALENINGLQSLESIGGEFVLENNSALLSLEGLESLTIIGLFVRMANNTQLTNLEGLENLTTIESNVTIYNLPELVSLEGLNSLTSVGGNFEIHTSHLLENLSGLESLNSVGGLGIYNNNSLQNLSGLNNLSTINSNFNISDNPILNYIGDLESLIFVGGNLSLHDNENLNICCSIAGIIQNLEGTINIVNNGIFCNSTQDILVQCIGDDLQVQAFYDENNNNLLEEEEIFLIQDFNLEPDAAFGFAGNDGISHFYLSTYGNYFITHNQDNELWNVNEGMESIEIDYTSGFPNDTIVYVPMSPLADFTIQRIDLTSSITRCNDETNYWITYTNQGTTTTNGYVELLSDELTNFVSANPPVDSMADGKLYWFYENLYPTHSNQIQVVYNMPTVDELGESIDFEAQVQTNEGFGDDKAVLNSELICAYDPNDKLVTPYGYGADNYTLFGDTLEYTVRFQNTGNDTAFTVIIEDQLSEYLDLTTFRPIASSHKVETQIDVESRLATFTFNDIYLPDSFVNEVGSHGFVKYRILGNADLSENTDVENTASIFFDQNPPIITNTVSNRMVSVLPSFPVIAATPNELNFGEVEANSTVPAIQTLTIQNLGDLPLEVTKFDFQDSAFNSGSVESLTIAGQSNEEVLIYFQPTALGNYQTELILNSNNEDLPVTLTGTSSAISGVESVNKIPFSLFPNPNEGQFYIKSKSEKIQSVKIQNSLGQVVFKEETVGELLYINLGKQHKGLYFVSVETMDGVLIEKLIVK